VLEFDGDDEESDDEGNPLWNPRAEFYDAHVKVGHQAVNKTLEELRKRQTTWRGMARDVRKWMTQCACQPYKPVRGLTQSERSSLNQMVVYQASKYLELVAIDVLKVEGVPILVMVDVATRRGFAEVIDTGRGYTVTARSVATILDKLFSEIGFPTRILHDGGSEFKQQCEELLLGYGIGIVNISVYNPQANGICERLNRSLLERMRMMRMERGEIQVQDMLRDAVEEYNRLAGALEDSERRDKFYEGVLVWRYVPRNEFKLAPSWRGPCVIVERQADGRSFLVRDLEGGGSRSVKRAHLKIYERLYDPDMYVSPLVRDQVLEQLQVGTAGLRYFGQGSYADIPHIDFKEEWTGKRVLLFPSTTEWDDVLRKVKAERPEQVVLLVPWWTEKGWVRELETLLSKKKGKYTLVENDPNLFMVVGSSIGKTDYNLVGIVFNHGAWNSGRAIEFPVAGEVYVESMVSPSGISIDRNQNRLKRRRTRTQEVGESIKRRNLIMAEEEEEPNPDM
jgi:transposase InsO family protein